MHLKGQIVLPIWTRPTSTETRLLTRAYANYVSYDHVKYEDQLYFFNSVLREKCHFPHRLTKTRYLDHRFDGAAEVAVLQAFVQRYYQPHHPHGTVGHGDAPRFDVAAEVVKLSDRITAAIGGSFERAIANRNDIHIKKGQRAGWIDATHKRLDAAQAERDNPWWWRSLDPIADQISADPTTWTLKAFIPLEATTAKSTPAY